MYFLLFFVLAGQAADPEDQEKGKYSLIRDADDHQLGTFDKPLPCFGCGIGWFSLVLTKSISIFLYPRI